MIHELKTYPVHFENVKAGVKTFEVRKDDRNFKNGDELLLREWLPKTAIYTGAICHRRITHILKGGKFGIEPGYVVLSLEKI